MILHDIYIEVIINKIINIDNTHRDDKQIYK